MQLAALMINVNHFQITYNYIQIYANTHIDTTVLFDLKKDKIISK